MSRIHISVVCITVLVLSSAVPGFAQASLVSGSPVPFRVGAGGLLNGGAGFVIDTPAGARLEVRAVALDCDANIDVYVRFEEDVARSGPVILRDVTGAGPDTTKVAVIVPTRAGRYFIAVGADSETGTAGTLIAIIDTNQDQTLVNLGSTPRPFSFGCVNEPTLFNSTPASNGPYSYRVVVPSGSTRLEVRLNITSIGGAQIDVYARIGTDVAVSLTRIVADFGPQPNVLTIASPAAGVYYVALRLITPDAIVSGTISATVTGQPTACTFSISPTSQSFAASGGTGSVNVTAGTGCAWAATSNAAFLTVTSGSSGTGNGTVNYLVSANTSNSSRTGTLTIAGQAFNVTQAGQAPPPTPAIGVSTTSLNFNTQQGVNPSSQTFTVRNAGGGTLNYQLSTNQTWLSVNPTQGNSTGGSNTHTASVNASSLGIGTFNGEIRVSLTAAPALSPEPGDPLQGSVVVILVQLTVTAQPGATPVISRGGVVNSASFAAATLPNGPISRGSIFTIFGTGLGPTSLATVSAFPLPLSLGGASVKVTRGGVSVDAIPLAVTATQINAIMPSNAPLGDASITVTFNNRTSPPVTARVVDTRFGIFAVNQNGIGPGIITNFVSQTEQPINSPVIPARPGQFAIIWGTGLGPITGADNVAPPAGDLPVEVEVFVGGKRASNKTYSGRGPCCAGLDQIVFAVPADAPTGCYVPVLVRAGQFSSNAVTMAIDAEGRQCSDPANPAGAISRRGGKLGVITLARAAVRAALPGQPTLNLTVDIGSASFSEERGGDFAFNPLTALPPLGSCTVLTAGNIDLSGVLGGQLPTGPSTSRVLNAGTPLTVSGSGGTRTIPRDSSSGSYFNLLGGTIPLPGVPSLPLFLEPGAYTITGPGGPDVGPFTANLNIAAQPTWTNRDQLTTVDRAFGVTLNWTGGVPASQVITIIGANVDQQTNAAGVFICFAPVAPGAFTVPREIATALPPSNLDQPDQSLGVLVFAVAPTGQVPTFTASGLDAGLVFFSSLNATTATYR